MCERQINKIHIIPLAEKGIRLDLDNGDFVRFDPFELFRDIKDAIDEVNDGKVS